MAVDGLLRRALLLTGVRLRLLPPGAGQPAPVWDRLPLAAALMGLFAAVIAERIGVRAGSRLAGRPWSQPASASVLWWHGGEVRGRGDLRPYALVQFYPLVAVPLMLYLFGPPLHPGRCGSVTVAVYGLAKVFELLDAPILAMGSVVSGHTLKHLARGGAPDM